MHSIIPNIKQIVENRKGITFLASPWSPPRFMKSNHMLILGGHLRKKYYKKYAEYLIKFIKEYHKQGIKISYITIQNEPQARQIWESCVYTVEQQKEFIHNYLIPSFRENNITTKIFIWDHNKEDLYNVSKAILGDARDVDDYIAGVAYHYYTGQYEENVRKVRNEYENLLLVHTEGCCGFSEYDEKDWIREGERYLEDISKDIANGQNGYFDWNILLDFNGGPNHVKNYCKSPVLIDKENKLIYTPIYYYLAHVSKFIKKDSCIIKNEIENINENIYNNFFVITAKKDKQIIVIITNKFDNEISFKLNIGGNVYRDKINKHSILTYCIPMATIHSTFIL